MLTGVNPILKHVTFTKNYVEIITALIPQEGELNNAYPAFNPHDYSGVCP